MAKKPKGDWQNEEVTSLEIGNRVWKLEDTVTPTGDKMVSLRAYVKRQSGDLIRTNHGFLIAEDAALPELEAVKALVEMAINIADKKHKTKSKAKAKVESTQYRVYNSDRTLVLGPKGEALPREQRSKALLFTSKNQAREHIAGLGDKAVAKWVKIVTVV